MSHDPTTIGAAEAQTLLRLGREIRELRDPISWRKHLARSLDELIGARVVLVAEVRGDAATHIVDHGLDHAERVTFLAAVRWARTELAREQLRSRDDVMVSNAPASGLGVISSIKMFRGVHERRFTARDRLLLQLVHEDLAADWQARAVSPRLTPRQQQVLSLLAQGASEKQIASSLGMSLHTAHDHVKAVYRSFAVHSRGELLARVAAGDGARPRVRLLVEDGVE